MRTWKPLLALFAVTGVAMACGGDTPVEPPATAEAGVYGTVTEGGVPVEGVTIQVFRADQGSSLGDDETDSDGAYAVTYPLAEEDELSEVVVTVAEEGYDTYEEIVPQGPWVQHDISLVWVGIEGTISGLVTEDESGDPIEGASVTGIGTDEDGAERQVFAATTGSDGSYGAQVRSPEEIVSVEVSVAAEGRVTVTGVLDFEDQLTFDASLRIQPFAGGDGSEDRPYEVETVDHLQGVAEHTDAHFVQVADIDASETAEWNDGEGFTPIGHFSGSYDGADHTIEGLVIQPEDLLGLGEVGLFAQVAGGRVENVRLTEVEVSGERVVGALAGMVHQDGEVRGSSASGTVSAREDTAGGLVGMLSVGVIDGSSASGSVSATTIAGGLVGHLLGTGTVEGSWADAEVTVVAWDAGGLVGVAEGAAAVVTQSWAAGEMTASGLAGGLVASVRSGATVSYSFSEGDVEAGDRAGGLVGLLDGEITGSYTTASVKADEGGGLVGPMDGGEIEGSYAAGTIEGDETGALIGSYADGDLSAVYFDEDVLGSEAAGDGTPTGYTALGTAEMTGEAAEASMNGFLFGAIWFTLGDDYPVLWWQ